jgi:hypothetical protein
MLRVCDPQALLASSAAPAPPGPRTQAVRLPHLAQPSPAPPHRGRADAPCPPTTPLLP